MKAIMLKDITDETRDYRKGQIIDVSFDPQKDETAVYHSYTQDNKIYKHWFNILCFKDDPNFTDVKIIDTEGYDLEKAIEVIIDENTKYVNRIIKGLRDAVISIGK
jgi:hypothetical protein